MRRAPPGFATRTSRPAPPEAGSSYDGGGAGMAVRQLLRATSHLPPFPYVTQPVERSSSMLSRSLPQPPHSVSFGRLASRRSLMLVPPTSQSLPRSPKIASLPSLYLTPLARQEPFGA